MSISERLKQNWKSGITVSLVSIPLSISLAVASQTSPIVGIITAIWAGLFASIFGGSNFNVVGPTGALAGVLASYAIVHGASSLSMLAIVSGIIIFIAYLIRLEKYLVFVPSSVIHGFTLGVAFIIGFGQINYALGLSGLPKHERFIENTIESVINIQQTQFAALAVFATFLAGLFILRKIFSKVPSAVLLTPVGIWLGYLSTKGTTPFVIETLGSKFGSLSMVLFSRPHFYFDTSLIVSGVTVAIVAILETMLSAKIADGMTNTKHDQHRELFGLCIANIVSGVVGGMPATAALARTSLNVKSGATNKISATVSSISVAVISVFFLTFFQFIPMAVIAAILVFVAINMVEAEHFKRYYKHDKTGFGVSLVVALVTVVEDPIVGMFLGTAVSLILFVEKISHGQFEITLSNFDSGMFKRVIGERISKLTDDADVILYSIRGKLCYINSRAHIARFEKKISDYEYVILRLREVYFVDLDGVEAINEIIDIVEAKGKTILVTSVMPNVESIISLISPQYRSLKERGLVFEKSEQAFAFLVTKTGSSKYKKNRMSNQTQIEFV